MNRLILKWSGYDKVKYLLDSMPEQDGSTFVIRAAEAFKVKTIIHGMGSNKLQSTIFFSTHHTGALDFLATYPALLKVAPNLKVVANKELLKLKPLSQISIGVHALSTGKRNIIARNEIAEHLRNGGNLLIFPAGKVGILKNGDPSDLPWQKGIADIIKRDARQVVPVLVDSKNNLMFYMIRKYFPKLNMLFLLRSLKTRKKVPINVYMGEPTNTSSYSELTAEELMNTIRYTTYALKKTENHGSK